MKRTAIFVLAALATGPGPVACQSVGDDAAPGVDAGSDADTDTDVDTDTDSDGDSDADAGSDAGPDASVIDFDCTDCPSVGGTVDHMLCAFDMCDPDLVGQNDYVPLVAPEEFAAEDTYEAVERFGDAANELGPKKNGSYALMATGFATGTAHSTQGSLTGIEDPWAVEETALTYDAVEWRLAIWAPEEAKAFRFKYVFFSVEYDEWISTQYNDKFYVFLEADSTHEGAMTLINFTDCRNPEEYWDFVCGPGDLGCEEGQKYCYIAINSAYSDCCWWDGCPDGFGTTDITGTGFECASDLISDDDTTGSSTGWLQTSWPIDGGEMFSLTFHLHDTADGDRDSEVILDAFEFLKDPEQGTVPIE